MLFTSFPLLAYLSIPIILSVPLKTLSIHLKSARAVEVVFPAWSVNFLHFFLAACGKVFRKASLRLWRNKSHNWQSLPSSNMVPYFVSFWLNGWNTDLGLETETHHIASFVVGGDESLASKSKLKQSNLFGESKLEADFWPGRPLSVPFRDLE